MNLGSLFGKIMGFLVIIITLALAPTIVTANAAIITQVSVNATRFIGMSVVDTFGPPLIILGLLAMGGIFAIAGVKGQMGGASMKDMFSVIGAVIVAVVILSLFPNILTYTDSLITASTGFAITIYSIIPLLIYIGIIAGTGWVGYSTYKKTRKGGKRSRAAVSNF